MIDFSTFILVLFSVLSAYLMWIHFSLIHRDFKEDIADVFREGSNPLFSEIFIWMGKFKTNLQKEADQIVTILHSQQKELDHQRRIIDDQTQKLLQNISSQNNYIQQLLKEQQQLQNELTKTQNIFNKYKKKMNDAELAQG